MDVGELMRAYEDRKPEIKERLRSFQTTEPREELAFCICTPQSKAKRCWEAVEMLIDGGKLDAQPGEIARILQTRVRFHNTKARHIAEAMKLDLSLLPGDPLEARDWLVANVKGLGMKEASHFLRNTGRGEDITILDRHILKNLKELGVISEVPRSLGRRVYLEIEANARAFSRKVGIPLAELDLLLWSLETGEVFK